MNCAAQGSRADFSIVNEFAERCRCSVAGFIDPCLNRQYLHDEISFLADKFADQGVTSIVVHETVKMLNADPQMFVEAAVIGMGLPELMIQAGLFMVRQSCCLPGGKKLPSYPEIGAIACWVDFCVGVCPARCLKHAVFGLVV